MKKHYYYMHYFFNRKNRGSFVVETMKNLGDFQNEDSFLEALIIEGLIEGNYAKQITKIERLDERTYYKLK